MSWLLHLPSASAMRAASWCLHYTTARHVTVSAAAANGLGKKQLKHVTIFQWKDARSRRVRRSCRPRQTGTPCKSNNALGTQCTGRPCSCHAPACGLNCQMGSVIRLHYMNALGPAGAGHGHGYTRRPTTNSLRRLLRAVKHSTGGPSGPGLSTILRALSSVLPNSRRRLQVR